MRRPVAWQEILALAAIVPVLVILRSAHPLWFSGVVFLAVSAASWLVLTFIAPLETLIHEFGHGLALVVLTPQRAELEVGHVDDPLTFSIGRVDVRMSLWQADGGHCRMVPEQISRPRMILICLAGPMASGLVAIALAFAAAATLEDHPFLFLVLGIGCVNAVLGFLNLLPSTVLQEALPGAPIEGQATDGLLILRALRGRRGRELWLPDDPATWPVGERLTEATHLVLSAARGRVQARRSKHAVGTADLLHALATVDRGSAGTLLRNHGADGAALDEWPAPEELPEPDSRLIARVLAAVGDRAQIEPVDLLRALLDDPTCSASRQLFALGVDRRALRAALDESPLPA